MLFRLNFIPPTPLAAIFFLMLLAGTVKINAQSHAFPARLAPQGPLSPVILVERPGAVQEFNVDPQQVRQMVNHTLLMLTSAQDIGTAWTRLGITPQDVVGIKITTAGGPAFCTHPALVQAICDGLKAAGVPCSQMIIWDKFQDKMTAAGYPPRAASASQAAIASIVPANNYDPAVFYKNALLGNLIWGDYQFNQMVDSDFYDTSRIVNRSYYTTFVTQTCTKLINVPVLSDNRYVGMDGCLSTLALGSTDNNRRFQGPPSYGDPAIDEILDKDFIRRKVVVHILDALVAQCAGGPTFNPQFCQTLGALYVSRDPVAIDSLVLPRLERLRREMNVPPIGDNASYIKTAPYYNLGTTDRRRIQFVRIP
ncbi:MAG: DUF362 domain-containing protein [Methylacidiphilales bacterium]|nr:DUF362 domain-containing protein [Candidatus Methylacidiphilales bacterium]